MSQAALAERVGTSQQSVDRIEKGQTRASRHIRRIIEALGLSSAPEGVGSTDPPDLADRSALLRMMEFRCRVCDLFNEFDDLPVSAAFHMATSVAQEWIALAALRDAK